MSDSKLNPPKKIKYKLLSILCTRKVLHVYFLVGLLLLGKIACNQSNLSELNSSVSSIEWKLDNIDSKLDDIDRKLGDMDGKLGDMDSDLNDLSRLNESLDKIRKKLEHIYTYDNSSELEDINKTLECILKNMN